MKPEKILDDVVQSAIGAKAHLDMWWAQTSVARPKFDRVVDAHAHFFRASRDAHYIAFFICFARLFEENKNSSSIWNYLRLSASKLEPELFTSHRARYKVLKLRAKSLVTARNKTVAHMDAALVEKEVFLPLKITGNDMRSIVSDTCDFVQELANAAHPGELGIPEGDMLVKATIKLLKKLEYPGNI